MSADNVGSDNHVGRDDSMPALVAHDDVRPDSAPSKSFLTSSLTAAGAYLLSWLRPRPTQPDTPGMRLVKRACSIVGSVAIAFGIYAIALTLFQHKLIYMMPRYSHHEQYYTNMLDSIELIVTASTLKKIALSAGVSPSVVPVLKQPLSWNQRRRAAIHLLPNERAVLGDAHRISIPLVPLRVPIPPLTLTPTHTHTRTASAMAATTVTSTATATVAGTSVGNKQSGSKGKVQAATVASTTPSTQTSSYTQEKRTGKTNSGKKPLHSRSPASMRPSTPSPDIVSELFLAEVTGAIATGTSLSSITTFTSSSYTTAATGAVAQSVAEDSHAVVFYVPSVADAVRMRAGKAPRGLTRRTVRMHGAEVMRKVRETDEIREKGKIDGKRGVRERRERGGRGRGEERGGLGDKRASQEKLPGGMNAVEQEEESQNKAANERTRSHTSGRIDGAGGGAGAAETMTDEAEDEENVLYVFTGGNAMSALDWLPTLRAYLSRPPLDPHASFLLVDYPGYGLSTGTPSPAAILSVCQRAVRAVLAYCRAVNAAADAVAVSSDAVAVSSDAVAVPADAVEDKADTVINTASKTNIVPAPAQESSPTFAATTGTSPISRTSPSSRTSSPSASPASSPSPSSTSPLSSPSSPSSPSHLAQHHPVHLENTCPVPSLPRPLSTLAAQHATMHPTSTQPCSAQPSSSPSSSSSSSESYLSGAGIDSAPGADPTHTPTTASTLPTPSSTAPTSNYTPPTASYTPRAPSQRSRSQLSSTTPTATAHTSVHTSAHTSASITAATPVASVRAVEMRLSVQDTTTTTTTTNTPLAATVAPIMTSAGTSAAITPLSSPGTPLARSRSVSFSVATVAASVDMPCGMRDGVRVCGEAFLQALAEDPTDTDDILPGNSKIPEYRLSGKIDGLGNLQIPDLEESGPSMSEQLFAEYSSPAKNGKQLQKLNSRNSLPFPESPHLFSPPPEVLSSLIAVTQTTTSTSDGRDAPTHSVHTTSKSRTLSDTHSLNTGTVSEPTTVVSRAAHTTTTLARTTSETNTVSMPVFAAQETEAVVPLPHHVVAGAVEVALRPRETGYGAVIENMATANAAMSDAELALPHEHGLGISPLPMTASHASTEGNSSTKGRGATEQSSCRHKRTVREAGPHMDAAEDRQAGDEGTEVDVQEQQEEEEEEDGYGVGVNLEDIPHVRLRLVGHSLGCAAALQMGAWVRSRGQYGITPGGRWSGAGVGVRADRLGVQGREREGDVCAESCKGGERGGERARGKGDVQSIWADDGLNVPVLPLYRGAYRGAKGRKRSDREDTRHTATATDATTTAAATSVTGTTGMGAAHAATATGACAGACGGTYGVVHDSDDSNHDNGKGTIGADAEPRVRAAGAGAGANDGELVMLHSDGRPLASLSLDRVVLASPFTSLYDMARALVGPIPLLHWLLQHPFNNVEAMQWVGGGVRGSALAGGAVGKVAGVRYDEDGDVVRNIVGLAGHGGGDGDNRTTTSRTSTTSRTRTTSRTGKEKTDSDQNRQHCGVFIMHGDRDGIVPVHMGRKLASEARKYSDIHVEYHELRNYGHNDVFEGEGEQWLLAAMRKRVCGDDDSNDKINQH